MPEFLSNELFRFIFFAKQFKKYSDISRRAIPMSVASLPELPAPPPLPTPPFHPPPVSLMIINPPHLDLISIYFFRETIQNVCRSVPECYPHVVASHPTIAREKPLALLRTKNFLLLRLSACHVPLFVY
jgi:hypothetical protein